MSRGRIAALVVVGIVVLANLVVATSDSLRGGSPSGPASSSYATDDDGVAAMAELLRRAGHDVEPLRTPPADATLEPADTVLVLDAIGVTQDDAARLRAFVANGGRLVVGGPPGRWLAVVAPDAPEWDGRGPEVARPLAPTAETRAVRRVTGGSGGSFRLEGPALPVLGGGSGALVATMRVGRGQLVLLGDVGPLRNAWLARDDNAALALGLAGPSGRPVRFAETFHGYEDEAGVAAIPDEWLAAFALGLVAVLVFMLARGRRLGPAEPDERSLAPARLGYVEAMGALLARTGDRDGAAAVLAARAGAGELAPHAVTDAELVALGREAARIESVDERRRA